MLPGAKFTFTVHNDFEQIMSFNGPVGFIPGQHTRTEFILEYVGDDNIITKMKEFNKAFTQMKNVVLDRSEIKRDNDDRWFAFYEYKIYNAEDFLNEIEQAFIWPLYSKGFDQLIEEELSKKT